MAYDLETTGNVKICPSCSETGLDKKSDWFKNIDCDHAKGIFLTSKLIMEYRFGSPFNTDSDNNRIIKSELKKAKTDSCKDFVDKQPFCPFCNTELFDSKLSMTEFISIAENTNWDRILIDEMIAIKSSNEKEYKKRLNKYIRKSAQSRQEILHELTQERQKQNIPKTPQCPNCGSTSITSSARGVNFMWGLLGASSTVNRCANCGNTWKPTGR